MECTPAEALKRLGIAPDFESTETDAKTGAKYIHRRGAGADWYFVALNNSRSKSFEASFRMTGLQPEIWDAEKGTIADAPLWRAEKGRTVVTLDFPPSGSAFVLFRRPAAGDHVASVAVKAQRRPEPTPAVAEEKFPVAIRKAVYGVFDASGAPVKGQTKDITSALSARIKDGRLSAVISNRLAGRDPAFRHHKVARVTYAYRGMEKTIMVKEHAELSLPPRPETPEPAPDWEWRGGDILAWQPLAATLKTAAGETRTLAAAPSPAFAVNCPWRVKFPVDWYTGGTTVKELSFAAPEDWTAQADPDIRYFSGTATYSAQVPYKPKAGERTILDLGVVKNFAVVTVNGKTFPTLWKPPFRLDVTDAVGATDCLDIEIKVTNLWPNRLIGDDFLKADCEWKGVVRDGVKEIGIKGIPEWVKEGKKSPTGRHTFTTWRHWSKDEAPLASGLLGPVVLRPAVIAKEVR